MKPQTTMRDGIPMDVRRLEEKQIALKRLITELGSAAVAFSGGVDSTLVLAVCAEVLESRLIAVTAASPLYPEASTRRAVRISRSLGVEHTVLETNELEDACFTSNPPERCYLCKRELYESIADIAAQRGIEFIVDGTQADDTGDYRPGMKAARELGVFSPLLETGFTKADARALSCEMGLETWDIPAGPCLASRLSYGEKITVEKLAAIEKAEALLEGLGFHEIRVRYTESKTARIEVSPRDIPALVAGGARDRIISEFKELGFLYVTLDLEGYRTGSMNEALKLQKP